jgi:ElaB/YqjD/DUF883 family membrane-anchored ribosome-binding protein
MKKPQNTSHFETPQAIRHDADTLVADAQALVAATAEIADEKVSAARERLTAALENGQEIYQSMRNRVVASAKAADEVVRENPYRMIGVSFGVGVLIGLLLKRRS